MARLKNPGLGRKPGPQLIRRVDRINLPALEMPAAVAESLRREFTDELRLVFRRSHISPDLIYAFSKAGRIVTEENRHLLTAEQHQDWKRALSGYRRQAEADERAIDLCYALLHESGRSEMAKSKRFAVSELGVATLRAHEEGVSSFAMEGAFFNAWLSQAAKRLRILSENAERLRTRFGAEVAELRELLEQIHDDLPIRSWSPTIERRIVKIEEARAAPETWLGKPPESNEEAEWEMPLAVEHLQNAIGFCQDITDDVMESMLLRSWFRTRVLNDRLPERFFQVLDANGTSVHECVRHHMAICWPSSPIEAGRCVERITCQPVLGSTDRNALTDVFFGPGVGSGTGDWPTSQALRTLS